MANNLNEKYEQQRNRQVGGIRAGLDYAMGVLFVIIGCVIIYKFKPAMAEVSFGVIAILYGVWRVYKGYKKNYRP